MHVADLKGFQRFPDTDWEHEGVAHTAAISAGSSCPWLSGCTCPGREEGRLGNLPTRGTSYKCSSQNTSLIQQRGWVHPQKPVWGLDLQS